MPALRREWFLNSIRRFAREKRAISAVEFALLVPVMLTLFLGGTELTQGITIKRKTTIATRTIADLVSQSASLDNTEMAAVFSATGSVLAPYSASNLKMVVSNIKIDANNVATVVWSDGYNGGTAKTAGAQITLPDGLNAFPKTSLIWAEAEYTYTPTIGYVVSGSVALQDKIYLRPRLVACVERKNGTTTITCNF
jgi:Flp pilus assembly protein TadG